MKTIKIQIYQKNFVRRVLLFLLSFCSAIAVTINPAAFDMESKAGYGFLKLVSLLRSELQPVGLSHVLALCALLFLYNRILFHKEHPFNLMAFLVSALLSLMLLLGMSFSAFTNFNFILGKRNQFVIALLVFLGIWVILYTFVKFFYEKLDSLKVKHTSYSSVLKVIDQHFLVFAIAVLLFSWTLFGCTYFPGSIPYDGRNQLNMFFGVTSMNLHHPFFSTQFMGSIYRAGYALCGIIGGSLLSVLFQSMLGAFVFSRISNYIRKKTHNIVPALVCLVYFAVAPMWWTYMQALIKDTIYFIFFAWFVLEYIQLLLKDSGGSGFLRMTIAAVCVCLFRNGGGVVVLPSLLLLVFMIDRKRTAIITFVIVLASDYGLNTTLMNCLDLKSDNQVEMYSIPLQQIARYVTQYENELTEEEKQIIDHVVQYDGIAERYDPQLADPVKNRYKNTTKSEWKEFWSLYLEKLKEHPIVFLEAAMNEVYGYIDPFHFYYGLTTYPLYNKDALGEEDEGIQYSSYYFQDNLRTATLDATYLWNQIPLLSFVTNPGFYTWLGIILLGALLRKKQWKLALIYVAPLMNVVICFASPVNGLVRYALPVMAAMPLFLLVGVLPYYHNQENKRSVGERKFFHA